jgi:hypothetical protein
MQNPDVEPSRHGGGIVPRQIYGRALAGKTLAVNGDVQVLDALRAGGSVRQYAQIGLQSLPGRFVRNSGAA